MRRAYFFQEFTYNSKGGSRGDAEKRCPRLDLNQRPIPYEGIALTN